MTVNFNNSRFKPLDIDAIKRDHSVVDVAVAAGLKLIKTGRGFKACCPFHDDQHPSFTIYADGMRWCCFAGCGEGDVFDLLAKLSGVGLREAAAMLTGGDIPRCTENVPMSVRFETSDRTNEARQIWDAAEPIAGTMAEKYLRSRCLHLLLPDTLRFVRLRYGWRGPEHPVMVAAIVDAGGELIGIQRTYLNSDGTGKLAVRKPKLALGRVSGGAIRLAPCSKSLIVTEGIEDALTLQQELGHATWAAAGATMLAKMDLPKAVHAVAIAGDADETGRKAAHRAAAAFTYRGIHTSMLFPTVGKDFNAELQEARG